jgi:putative acetyltransferase
MSPVEIRPITMHDVPGFHAALDTVAREQRYLAQVAAPPVDRIEGFVHESVSKDLVQFVAVADGTVVGWADVLPEWAQALAHTGSLGMGLLPAWRGQGLGARLLQACIHKAWAKGLTRIELAARADNTRAIRLYERLGFQHEGIKRRGMRFDGVYFDTVSMGLLRPEEGSQP